MSFDEVPHSNVDRHHISAFDEVDDTEEREPLEEDEEE